MMKQSIVVYDPRVHVTPPEEQERYVLKGGTRVTEYRQTSNSNSDTQASWSFQPPSTKTIVDRHFLLRCKVRVTALGGGNFQFGVNDAPRQMPLTSIMESVDIRINGGSVSDNLADRVHAMLTFDNDAAYRNGCWSSSPAMPDNYQQLSDWQVYGSGKNPLADYGENAAEDTRGGFPRREISPTVSEYEFTEPILISPMLNSCEEEEEGFVNVNQIDITIRWASNLARLFSHSFIGDVDDDTVTGVRVEFIADPELLVRYITPDLNQVLPPLQCLPYYKYNDYIKALPLGLTPGASLTAVSDTIKFNQIPRKLMIFARRSRATTTFRTADSFAGIEKISLLWNNESSLLASATSQDLWTISKRNGSNLTWSQWSKYRGGVFCAEFGVDIGLARGLAPGVVGQFTLQAQVEFKNLADANIDLEFYMCVMLEGSVQITENTFAQSLGDLTVADVEAAEASGKVMTYKQAKLLSGGRGKFGQRFKNFIKKIARGIQKIGPVIRKLSPIADQFFPGSGQAIRQATDVAEKVSGVVLGGRRSGGMGSGGMGSGGQRRLMRRPY